MKVATYQTDPVLLDIKANLEDTISKIHHAKEKKADLIVFPELALTGYFVGEKYHEVALKIESTLKEACSWDKVDLKYQQMVFGEATITLPLLASDAFHRGIWRDRSEGNLSSLLIK